MKRHFIYTFAALALVLSCNRTEPENSSLGESIRIGATLADAPATKAFINKNDLKGGTANPEVKIYDDLTSFTGTINGNTYENGAVNYIDDTMVWASGVGESATWNFNSGINWRWTRTGVHHFYGWLTKDPEGLQNNGAGTAATFNATTKVLSVPAITFTKDTPQFDFSYSDIVAVDVQNSGFNAANSINLPLKHLFTALGVSIQNSGNDPVNIVSVAFNGLINNRSANINFSGETSKVNLTDGTTDVQFLTTLAEPMNLNPGGTKIDLVEGDYISSSTLTSTYLMWPQSAEEIWADNGLSFTVVYTIDEVMDPAAADQLQIFTKTLKLKDSGFFGTAAEPKGLEAGQKYYLNLQFKAKSIDLTLQVMPWDYTEFDLDYTSSSISANNATGIDNEGVMWLYTRTFDVDGNEIHIPGPRDRLITLPAGGAIYGKFYVGSPHNGQWQITTYPEEASHYFRLEPSEGELTPELITQNAGLVEFYIYPVGQVEVQETLHLNLAFRFNGESQWRDGNSEFNRKDWRIVREP